jgi:hypothetical protein
MSAELLPVLRPVRVPWNKGRIIGQARPLMPRHVRSTRVRLEIAGKTRDLALFNMAVDGKLRGCDLVGLRVLDILAAGRLRHPCHATDPASQVNNVKSFKGRDGIRLRVGDWRVIMDDQGNVLAVLDIGPRGGVDD